MKKSALVLMMLAMLMAGISVTAWGSTIEGTLKKGSSKPERPDPSKSKNGSTNYDEKLGIAIKDLPPPFDTLKKYQDKFKKTLTRQTYYKVDLDILGQRTVLYVFWITNKATECTVIAAVLPDKLASDKLFNVGSDFDLGINKPIILHSSGESIFSAKNLPDPLLNNFKNIGMPSMIKVSQGFSLYGQIATGFVAKLLKDEPFNLDPGTLFAGITKGPEGIISQLSIDSKKPWEKPFGLADTTIKGGTVTVTSKAGLKTVEAWGTAALGKNSKEFTFYGKRDGASGFKSVGFDARDASVEDYFLVLGVVGKTLGLPAIPVPSKLPLKMVTLSNPAYRSYSDASSLLDFDKMMFKGNEYPPELITNAAGKIFGQKVAEIKLKTSSENVHGEGSLDAGLGPLKAAKADFYLNVPKTGTPAMGVKAGTVFGDLDLQADATGLNLDVPPKCPLKPVGITAHLTDLSLSEFPIKPKFEACFADEIKGIVNGTLDAGEDAVKFGVELSVDAASTAKDMGTVAGKAVTDLVTKRPEAWVKAVADMESAKDAKKAAKKAYDTADGLVSSLGSAIGSLEKDIENISKKIWKTITGGIKGLLKQKSEKIAERDQKRTEQAAAEARRAEAKKSLEAAEKNLQKIPGPNIAGAVVDIDQQYLAETEKEAVQGHVAKFATQLAADMKDETKRKELLKTVDPDKFAADHKEAFEKEHPKLSAANAEDLKALLAGYRDESKKALVAHAISGSIEAETEKQLEGTVVHLPTMAFEVPVRIMHQDSCLYPIQIFNTLAPRTPCTKADDELFVFHADGKVTHVKTGKSLGLLVGLLPAVSYDEKNEAPFFFDPVEGQFRFPNRLAGHNLVSCIENDEKKLTIASCGPNTAGWRLVADKPPEPPRPPKHKGIWASNPKTKWSPAKEWSNVSPLRLGQLKK